MAIRKWVSDHAITLSHCACYDSREPTRTCAREDELRPPRTARWPGHGPRFAWWGMGGKNRTRDRPQGPQGLGFRVICTSRSLVPGRRTPEGYDIVEYEELLRRADVVSFTPHARPTRVHSSTRTRDFLMKPDAHRGNNTARGAVSRHGARQRSARKLWGAGIVDVFENEPVERNHPLLSAPPHAHAARSAVRKNRAKRLRRRAACKPRSTS